MFGKNVYIFRKKGEVCVIFCVLLVISCASEIFTGNFANLNEGYSNIDVTGDGKPEIVFLKKCRVKGAVSKLVITDTDGRLLFYVNNEGGYIQVYVNEEDIAKKNEFLDEPYNKLILKKEEEAKHSVAIGQKPIVLEISEEEKSLFKVDTPVEKKMQDVQQKLLILGKNGVISRNVSSFGFIVYYEKNDGVCISCFTANRYGKPISDKLVFKWDEQNGKFTQIGISP